MPVKSVINSLSLILDLRAHTWLRLFTYRWDKYLSHYCVLTNLLLKSELSSHTKSACITLDLCRPSMYIFSRYRVSHPLITIDSNLNQLLV